MSQISARRDMVFIFESISLTERKTSSNLRAQVKGGICEMIALHPALHSGLTAREAFSPILAGNVSLY